MEAEESGIEGLTVNLHITSRCNYRCKYCFEVNEGIGDLPVEHWEEVLRKLKKGGVRKVSFAGGEPLLYRGLGELLEEARGLGFGQVSLITNGRYLSDEWLEKNLSYLDGITISLDSAKEDIQREMGRGKGDCVFVTRDAWFRVRKWSEKMNRPVYMRINTVVNRLNLEDDPSDLFLELKPNRVKLLQFCAIEGENDLHKDLLKISRSEFQSYVGRILPKLSNGEIRVAVEDEESLRNSYLILDPSARFCDKRGGRNRRGLSLADSSLSDALKSVYTEEDLRGLRRNMIERGGIY